MIILPYTIRAKFIGFLGILNEYTGVTMDGALTGLITFWSMRV